MSSTSWTGSIKSKDISDHVSDDVRMKEKDKFGTHNQWFYRHAMAWQGWSRRSAFRQNHLPPTFLLYFFSYSSHLLISLICYHLARCLTTPLKAILIKVIYNAEYSGTIKIALNIWICFILFYRLSKQNNDPISILFYIWPR